MKNVPVLAHNRRDGDYVIDFRGVSQAKHQSNTQNSQHAP
jgi:hypothetical protein